MRPHQLASMADSGNRVRLRQSWRRRRLRLAGAVAAALVAALTVLGLAGGQQIRREGFEGRDPLWVKGPSDAAYRELAHQMTEDNQHKGQRSETIHLVGERGTFIHYLYDTGRAMISEELSASVWVRANRPGIQLLARLVLPHERNPNNLEEPLTTLVGGDVYQTASRWQRLELRRPTKVARDQQALLRAELKRDVNLDDAYIDRLVLNLYAGPGDTEVWIDDLEVGPVLDPAPAPTSAGPQGGSGPRVGTLAGRTKQRTPQVIELDRDQLRIGGKNFFFRAIRRTDTPLDVLRAAGFNTIYLDDQTPPEVLHEAVDQGFWIVPSLPIVDGPDGPPGDTFLTANSNFNRRVSRFLELDPDAILFWDVGGGGLTAEHSQAVAKTAQLVRLADPQRPLAADVWDGFQPYSRSVNLLGVHRWPLMTSLELPEFRDWLNQRRLLAPPGTFMWTWVQTHLPDWHTTLVYDHPGSTGFSEPVGPLPEQIRLLTYTALASGARGLGFWSDRFLADSHQGRDRLLALALINQELKMLEPLLLSSNKPDWIGTSSGEVRAAVFRSQTAENAVNAVLVLPIWMGRGAQFVPGQGAVANLSIVVPQVPDAAEAWEVSPGEVRPLRTERVRGGTQVVIPEFGLTGAVVFTADNSQTGLLVRLQDQARRTRKLAAQWGHDLAEAETEKVARIYADIEQRGHPLPEGRKRLEDARAHLQRCADKWNDGDYSEAYREANRAVRPLGLLMRRAWEAAAGDLDAPVASPYAVSYFTLPRHWAFADQLKAAAAGPNVLPNGDFETVPDRSPEAWAAQAVTLDEVDLAARRVTESPHGGQQCLQLEIKPKNKDHLPPAALERTFLAIHSPAVRLQPGTLVRITGWVRIPATLAASADGALLYDSAGGEPLAIRLQGPITKWREFTWYRRVPASGDIHVTLALTGLGKVYFDDVRLEPLEAGRAPATTATLVSLRSPKPPEEKKKPDSQVSRSQSER
jgi:hypothetical protein